MMSPAKGILLIAEPFLKDPAFMRTVVLLCRHTEEEGTFGFTVNKSSNKTLNKLIAGMEPFKYTIYDGGPVQVDTLHFLHKYPEYFPNAEKIVEGAYWGGDFELLKTLMWAGKIEEEKIKFFLGYSGWSAGQLSTEMEQKSWLTVEANEELIMDTAPESIWKKSLYTLGGEYKMMANFPTDPQLN